MSIVGRNIRHDSAATHVTGESVFIDDNAPVAGELVVELVPAPFARGRLVSVDVSAGWRVPGVVAILTAKDVPGHNRFGPVVQDEDLLVEGESQYLGHAVAVIGAESRAAATAARDAVKVVMEELPPVLTIDEAIAAGSFLGAPGHMARGDLDAGFAGAEHVVSGEVQIGGQEHFYLESQACIVTPGEPAGDGRRTMHVNSSTQHPSEVQAMVAEVLGVAFSHVVCSCRRMGGGFGGKETQAAQPAMYAALVAGKTGRTARCVFNRDDDMALTGKRHPFKAVYKVGYSSTGQIAALDLALYSNGGCSTDLSFAVLERSMLHSDNAYFLPAVRIVGRVCKTNLPSNTAFRGFGGPQGVAVIESILEQVAIRLGKDPADVRAANLYGIDDRNTTHYGQLVANNTLHRLHAELRESSRYDVRRREITAFNAASGTHVKGLAMSFVKFGISFTRRTLNQANALVNIYLDGSVQVSTGATEMGQGVYTRIGQVVADALGVRLETVRVMATSTEKNNNTSPTAASTGTDLNGSAAVDACVRLRGRLAEVAAGMLGAADVGSVVFAGGEVFSAQCERRLTFRQVVAQAYEIRVSLGERGFYATPGVDFNRETGQGAPFLYYTNGAAVAEVLIDRLTGEMKTTRVDLLMDVGQSINPGIDRGQIIGGFVQGMGWVTVEELIHSPKGALLTHSPDTYKIPAISDVPGEFNVRFLENPDNVVSLHRSKAVGEPPLLLGLSVWLAAKNAVSYVSAEAAISLALPATGERVLKGMGSM
jgi:xanthine dehydrogenase large subunit